MNGSLQGSIEWAEGLWREVLGATSGSWSFQGTTADLWFLDTLWVEASLVEADLPRLADLWGQIVAHELGLVWSTPDASVKWLVSKPDEYFRTALQPLHYLQEAIRNANPEDFKLTYAYEKAAVHVFIQSASLREGSRLTLNVGGGYVDALTEAFSTPVEDEDGKRASRARHKGGR